MTAETIGLSTDYHGHRAYLAAHPEAHSYERAPIEHEFCDLLRGAAGWPAVGWCVDVVGIRVRVQRGPVSGTRLREPVWGGLALPFVAPRWSR